MSTGDVTNLSIEDGRAGVTADFDDVASLIKLMSLAAYDFRVACAAGLLLHIPGSAGVGPTNHGEMSRTARRFRQRNYHQRRLQ